MQITTGQLKTAQRAVIYGPEGIGKTTLASHFPRPLWIDVEGSSKTLDVARTPKPASWRHLLAILEEASQLPDFDTIVIDTADWCERLAQQDVCATAGVDSIEAFGYGKGFTFLAERWVAFLDMCSQIVDARGKHLVIIAHATLRKFEQPDEKGAYDRFELKLTATPKNNLSAMLKEWADMVLFCNYRTIVETDPDTKKARARGGKRIIYTTHHTSWDAKNRHGFPEELDMLKDKLPAEIGAVLTLANKPAAKPEPEPQKEQAEQPAAKREPVQAEPKPAVEAQPAEDTAPSNAPDPTAFHAKLYDQMALCGVTADELKTYIVRKGFFGPDMPIDNLPEHWVGRALKNWEKITADIKEHRNNG